MRFLDFWAERRGDFDAVFLDIDGTVIDRRRMLKNADLMLETFRNGGTPFLFLTNDANHSTIEKAAIVNRTGLKIAPDDIVSSGDVLKSWARRHGAAGKKFFMMGVLGHPCYAEKSGLVTTTDTAELDDCAGVLVGEDDYDWYSVFFEVFNFFLRHPDRPLISPNPDICWAGWKRGGLGLGAGAVAEAMQLWLSHQKLDVKPVFLGKPHTHIFDFAIDRLNLPDRSRILMLGDSLRGDMAGANAARVRSGLLLTGITTADAAGRAADAERPEFIFSGL
ncbi:MAG: HAD hydrolase-like protein [Victivallaceae bacterium]|nr:HAD hydrolase-like protein [Victivallaceae bacterium]